jgi:hypothetical protein
VTSRNSLPPPTGAYDDLRSHNPKIAGSNPVPATTEALVDRKIGQGFSRFGCQRHEANPAVARQRIDVNGCSWAARPSSHGTRFALVPVARPHRSAAGRRTPPTAGGAVRATERRRFRRHRRGHLMGAAASTSAATRHRRHASHLGSPCLSPRFCGTPLVLITMSPQRQSRGLPASLHHFNVAQGFGSTADLEAGVLTRGRRWQCRRPRARPCASDAQAR